MIFTSPTPSHTPAGSDTKSVDVSFRGWWPHYISGVLYGIVSPGSKQIFLEF